MVPQRNAHDCGVAALATALCWTYEHALAALGRDPATPVTEFEGHRHVGILPDEMSLVAFNRRIPCHVATVPECASADTWQHAWRDVLYQLTLADIERRVFGDKVPAVLGVPSRNVADQGHWLAVRDGTLYDPAQRNRYVHGEPVDVWLAVLFQP